MERGQQHEQTKKTLPWIGAAFFGLGVVASFDPALYGQGGFDNFAQLAFAHSFMPVKFATIGFLFDLGRARNNKHGEEPIGKSLTTGVAFGAGAAVIEGFIYYIGGNLLNHAPIDLAPFTLDSIALGDIASYGITNSGAYFIGRAAPSKRSHNNSRIRL